MQSRFKLVLGFALLQPGAATVCPYCFGNIPSCTFGAATRAACPAEVVPRENAAIITGSASGSLKLAGCLAPRFLRMLTRAELTTITTLANRPPPGTAITFTAATKLKDLVVYMKQGLISREQIEVTFAEFIDAEKDAAKKKDLRENVKFLMSAAEDAGSDEEPGGLYTWLLGMVTSFVLTGTVVTTSALSSGSSPGTSSTSTAMHKTKVPRPKTILHLLEILNLYVMFFVALGLGPTSLITSFIQCVVIDSIVVRKYEWYIAYELMIVLFRKIENSVGNKFNLGNVIDEVHLNSALEEATEAAKMFFRAGGGNLRLHDKDDKNEDDKNKKPYNGKGNSDRTCRPCAVFNAGGTHKPHMLNDDGSCRFCQDVKIKNVKIKNAITGFLTKAPAVFAGTRRARRAILALLAITLTSATPSSSESSGVAEVARLRSLVETEGACALPGCTIKDESFTQVIPGRKAPGQL